VIRLSTYTEDRQSRIFGTCLQEAMAPPPREWAQPSGRLRRRIFEIPKDQQELLDRPDAWDTSRPNVPISVLESLKDFERRNRARKAGNDKAVDDAIAVVARSSTLPPQNDAGIPSGEDLEELSDNDGRASAMSWSLSPDREQQRYVPVHDPPTQPSPPPPSSIFPSQEVVRQVSPENPSLPSLPRKPAARSLPFPPFPSSSLSTDEGLEVQVPRAITDIPEPLERRNLTLQPDPTPPSAQFHVIPSTFVEQASSAVQLPEPEPQPQQKQKRRRLMKMPDFGEFSIVPRSDKKPATRSRVAGPPSSATLEGPTPVLPFVVTTPVRAKANNNNQFPTTPSHPPPETPLTFQTRSKPKAPKPRVRRASRSSSSASSPGAFTTSPVEREENVRRGTSVEVVKPEKRKQIPGPGEDSSLQDGVKISTQKASQPQLSSSDRIPPNGPASQVPYTAFKLAYPDYQGSLLDFLRGVIVLRQIADDNVIAEFIYDDFVRVFSGEYLDYIRATSDSSPLTCPKYYHKFVKRICYTSGLLTRECLHDVLDRYPDEVMTIERVLFGRSKPKDATGPGKGNMGKKHEADEVDEIKEVDEVDKVDKVDEVNEVDEADEADEADAPVAGPTTPNDVQNVTMGGTEEGSLVEMSSSPANAASPPPTKRSSCELAFDPIETADEPQPPKKKIRKVSARSARVSNQPETHGESSLDGPFFTPTDPDTSDQRVSGPNTPVVLRANTAADRLFSTGQDPVTPRNRDGDNSGTQTTPRVASQARTPRSKPSLGPSVGVPSPRPATQNAEKPTSSRASTGPAVPSTPTSSPPPATPSPPGNVEETPKPTTKIRQRSRLSTGDVDGDASTPALAQSSWRIPSTQRSAHTTAFAAFLKKGKEERLRKEQEKVK
jgi:hypothetical protein